MLKRSYFLAGVVLVFLAALIFDFELPRLVKYPSPYTPKIDPTTFDLLQNCAKHHTKKLGKFGPKDINRLKDFVKNQILPNGEFGIFLFEYNPSRPWIIGKWTCNQLIAHKYKFYSKELLDWLNRCYHSDKYFQFFYYGEEPYYRGRLYHFLKILDKIKTDKINFLEL